MSTMVRKNITMPQNIYEEINEYALKNGFSFSEFLRTVALNEIKKNNEMNLLEFLNSKVSDVSIDESKEIDNMNIDFDSMNGEELTLDEFL